MKSCFYILVSLLFITESYAQQLHYRKHQLPPEFRNEKISSIYQTRDNFIWLGTSNGIFRFDGINYRQFINDSIPGGAVTALFQDKKGSLWIGYENGVVGVFENNAFQPFHPEEGFPKESITGFAEDAEGNLWFSTYGEGVYFFKDGRMYNLNMDDGLNDNYCYTIATGPEGSLYVATDAGVAVCSFKNNEKSINKISSSSGLPDNLVTSLKFDEDFLWIGMESEGICRYNLKTDTIDYLSTDWKYGRIRDLQPSKLLYASTANGGVVEVDINSNTTVFTHPPDYSTKLATLMADSESNLWLVNGTSSFYLMNPLFTFITQVNGSPIKNVQAVLASLNGSIWISKETGVYQIQNDQINPVSPLSNVNIISLYEDHKGRIWMGTFDRGIYIYNPETGDIKILTEDNGLINNNVLSIDGSGNEIWLATLGGVSKYNLKNSQITNYSAQNGLGSNYIYQVFIDSGGRVWFATDGNGVIMFNGEKFNNYSSAQGLTSNVVYSITEDTMGDIWVSTSNSGIFKFSEGKFKEFSPHNEIQDLSITAIIGDSLGNVLLVSNSGVDLLNINDSTISYYHEEAGINQIEPNLNAYSIDRNNSILLGTQTGIIKYNPQKKKTTSVTSVNEMQVFLRPSVERTLNYDQNHISFDYKGFWFQEPEEVTYMLKLEGYDREWMKSRNSFITYPNLPPGDYTFRVKSSSTGYFHNTNEQTMAFSISPPFYNTIWFYLLIGTGALGLIILFVKNRETRLKEDARRKKELVEFRFETLKSQVNPHFLFNSFNILIAVIEEDQELAVEYVEKLSDLYRNILIYRDQDIIPLKDEVEMIRTYQFLQHKRFKDNFILNINVPEHKNHFYIPPMTLQLLIENAIKHNIVSRDKPLNVDIHVDNDYLIIMNNLQPKKHKEPSTGMGLSNVVQRYKLLTKKEVHIESNEFYYIIKVPLLER